MFRFIVTVILVGLSLQAWGQIGIGTYIRDGTSSMGFLSIKTSPKRNWSMDFRIGHRFFVGIQDEERWWTNWWLGTELRGFYRIKIGDGIHALVGAGGLLRYSTLFEEEFIDYGLLIPVGIEVDPGLTFANITISFETTANLRTRKVSGDNISGSIHNFIGITYYLPPKWGSANCPNPFD